MFTSLVHSFYINPIVLAIASGEWLERTALHRFADNFFSWVAVKGKKRQ